jgi:hypothetical protein
MISDLILNIEYLKAMPFFNELSLDDQEVLAIYVGLVNTVLVQSFYSYMNNSRTLMLPDGRIPLLRIQAERLNHKVFFGWVIIKIESKLNIYKSCISKMFVLWVFRFLFNFICID